MILTGNAQTIAKLGLFAAFCGVGFLLLDMLLVSLKLISLYAKFDSILVNLGCLTVAAGMAAIGLSALFAAIFS